MAMVLAAGFCAAGMPSASAEEVSSFTVVAHRASTLGFPEHSRAGIYDNLLRGITDYEMDVRFTKDGVPVILHDTTLDRTTSCRGKLSNYSWHRASHCRLENGERLMSLRAAAQLLEGKKLWLHVKEMPRGGAKKIAQAIAAGKHRAPDTVAFHSLKGAWDNLYAQGFTTQGWLAGASVWTAPASRYAVLVPYRTAISQAMVSDASSRGQRVYAVEGSYRCSNAPFLADLGLSGIIANDTRCPNDSQVVGPEKE